MLARGMHVLNGCNLLPTHTYTTIQHGHMVVRTTMDYIILYDVALHMAKSLALEDHSPRRMAKSFHVHLALMLTCQQGLLQALEVGDALGCHI